VVFFLYIASAPADPVITYFYPQANATRQAGIAMTCPPRSGAILFVFTLFFFSLLQAYVLYNFFVYLLAYLRQRPDFGEAIATRDPQPHTFPLKYCFACVECECCLTSL
jgi:hypothetical protein